MEKYAGDRTYRVSANFTKLGNLLCVGRVRKYQGVLILFRRPPLNSRAQSCTHTETSTICNQFRFR